MDPIGLAGGINQYGYASGDPVNLADAFGLCPRSAGGSGNSESLDDCPRGTSGWWAMQDQGGVVGLYNNLRGLAATCSEHTGCAATAGLGALAFGGAVALQAAAASIAGASASPWLIGGASIIPAAMSKLGAVSQQVGMAKEKIVDLALAAPKFVDLHNRMNVNVWIARLDGGSGMIRVTFSPGMERIISAGITRADQISAGVASGRFVPIP